MLSGEINALEITSRGFAYTKENDPIFEQAKDVVRRALANVDLKEEGEWNGVRNIIRKELKSFLFRKTRRNPMILSMILEN